MLISYQKLAELTGYKSYKSFQKAHRVLIDESLLIGKVNRQPEWTESIAVGSERFIEEIKQRLRSLARGRKIIENQGRFQLREKSLTYNAVSGSEKEDIGDGNRYFWE